MKPLALTFLALALATSMAHAATKPASKPAKGAVAKKIYCWNEHGTKMCGDSLPADAVDQARTEVNAKTGLTTKQIDRVLTPEEVALAQRQAQAQQAQQAQQTTQAQRVQMLVFTYPTEQALVLAQNEAEADMRTKIAATEKGIREVRLALVDRLKSLGEYELNNKPVPRKQIDQLAVLREQMKAQYATLHVQQEQMQQTQALNAQNLDLYRQAKAQAPAP